MSIPNILTFLRIILIPWFAILLFNGSFNQALWVFAGAAVTDGLDGFIARWFSQKTQLGAFLDPVADKLLLSTAYIALAVMREIPVWLTVIVISRDVVIVLGVTILFLNQVDVEMKPTIYSKLTTVFQVLLILLVLSSGYIHLAEEVKLGLILVTLVFTVFSGFHYIHTGLKILP
ncbi:MAG: CDP-alcohol phosphatidyltransferase family protein [Thermodesulfobacteriota bacterium]